MPSVSFSVSAANARPAPAPSDQRPSEPPATPFADLLDLSPTQPPAPPAPPARNDNDPPPSSTAADDSTAKPADHQPDKSSQPGSAADDQPAQQANSDRKPTAAPQPQAQASTGKKTDQTDGKAKDKTTDDTSIAAAAAGATDASQVAADPSANGTPASDPATATAAAVPVAVPVPVLAASAAAATVASPSVSAGSAATAGAVSAKITAAAAGQTRQSAGAPDDQQPAVVIPDNGDSAGELAQLVGKPKIDKPAPKGADPATVKPGVPDGKPDNVAPADAQAAPGDPVARAIDVARPDTATAKPHHDKAETVPDQGAPAAMTVRTDAGTNQSPTVDVALQNPLPVATAAAAASPASQSTQASSSTLTVPIGGLAVEIVSKAKEGTHSFDIRLDPPDLGHIHVKLDVDGQGNVTSRLVVERQDTLDLLRRDSAGLERALNDAGLKTNDNGLQFSLRDQSSGNNWQQRDPQAQTTRVVVPTDAAAPADAPRYRMARLGGVDIRV